MSRRPFIIGNWKMHGTRASCADLLNQLLHAQSWTNTVDVAVLPPFVYIGQAVAALAEMVIAVGAQNVCHEEPGAFTGEVAASQLVDVGCRYVLLGHSERRQLFGETNEDVLLKYGKAMAAGLCPILCVGETLAQRKADLTERVVCEQLETILLAIKDISEFDKLIIAYEPVWAIGTGLMATPEQANEIHGILRRCVAEIDKNSAEKIKILYGGSVKADNIAALLAQPHVDGGLVGGASLIATEFLKIIEIASQAQQLKGSC